MNGSLDRQFLHLSMSAEQLERYLDCIWRAATARGVDLATPEVLFEAAMHATALDGSNASGRIGLQPGTMDPVHYGHILAALGGVVEMDLNGVILAPGASVPDKPFAGPFQERLEMARLAAGEEGLRDWLAVSKLRHQTFEMLSPEEHSSKFVADDPVARRAITDIAAFIWLFSANRGVEWVYIVGSDKVADFGRKGESDLVEATLSEGQANVRFVYCANRDARRIDVEADILPYEWLRKRWQAGFFRSSSLAIDAPSASQIRATIAEGIPDVNGVPLGECVNLQVLDHIRRSDTLRSAYVHSKRDVRSSPLGDISLRSAGELMNPRLKARDSASTEVD